MEDLDDPMMTVESEVEGSHEMSTGEVEDDEPVLSGLPGKVTAVKKNSKLKFRHLFSKERKAPKN